MDKRIDQQGNIILSLPQGGQLHRENVDPVKQVFSKQPFRHPFGQVPVGGRDDPDVDVDRTVAADAYELFGFQDAQQFGLGRQRNVSDFIQKNITAVAPLWWPNNSLSIINSFKAAQLILTNGPLFRFPNS